MLCECCVLCCVCTLRYVCMVFMRVAYVPIRCMCYYICYVVLCVYVCYVCMHIMSVCIYVMCVGRLRRSVALHKFVVYVCMCIMCVFCICIVCYARCMMYIILCSRVALYLWMEVLVGGLMDVRMYHNVQSF